MTTKRKTISALAGVGALVATMFMLMAPTTSATTNSAPCDQPTITVVDSPAGWQRYSWTGGPIPDDPAPAFPGPNWQPNVAGDPHGIGHAGAYFVSHGASGGGDWFYLEAVAEVTHEEPNPAYPCQTTTVPTTTVPDTTVPDGCEPDAETYPTTTECPPDTTVPTTTVPDTTVPPTTVPDPAIAASADCVTVYVSLVGFPDLVNMVTITLDGTPFSLHFDGPDAAVNVDWADSPWNVNMLDGKLHHYTVAVGDTESPVLALDSDECTEPPPPTTVAPPPPPPPTDPPAVTPTCAADPSQAGCAEALPRTGGDYRLLLTVAGILLVLGVALVVVTRDRVTR